jgi:hypothetical protein
MIKLLRQKWPGVFKGHRKAHEVMMLWKYRQPLVGLPVAKHAAAKQAAAKQAAAKHTAAAAAAAKPGGQASRGLVRGVVAAFTKAAGAAAEDTWVVEWEGEEEASVVCRLALEAYIALAE